MINLTNYTNFDIRVKNTDGRLFWIEDIYADTKEKAAKLACEEFCLPYSSAIAWAKHDLIDGPDGNEWISTEGKI